MNFFFTLVSMAESFDFEKGSVWCRYRYEASIGVAAA